jgi:hypothetical protein
VVFIDDKNWPRSKFIMRIKRIDGHQWSAWIYVYPWRSLVPLTKTFKIVKRKNDDDIKILGGTIQFDGDVEDNFTTRKK